jgi:hypothetical protein
MRIKGDGIMVELEHEGEGYNGDFDPADGNDKPLMRFWVYEDSEDENYGEQLENGSYCTELIADDDPEILDKAINLIHHEAVQALAGKGSFKRTMEKLSWLHAEDERLG